MKLKETYLGTDEAERFEGDLTLLLHALPEGARATRATVLLDPVAAEGGNRFEETIVFNDNRGELGATATVGADFLEVDFHHRRTLARVIGEGGNFTLQVDMGGAWVGVAANGSILAGNGSPWTVTLPAREDNLPGLTVNRFRLTRSETGGADIVLNAVNIRAVPSNLQLRLGQMAPFWVRLGELSQSETSPDFSAVLNFFLQSAPVENGHYRVPLVLRSESLARLKVTIDITYVVETSVLPPHLSEVCLPYDFSTLPDTVEGLLTLRLPRGAVPLAGRTGGAVRGKFAASRLALGEPGELPKVGSVAVAPSCALAQAVVADKEIALTAVDLLLAATGSDFSGLHLSLMADADGKPSGTILAVAEVKVAKPLPDGNAWGSAELSEPFRVLAATRYWLVLQSRTGQALWGVNEGPAGQLSLQCSRDGGLSWRSAGGLGLPQPLAALYRLRHVPERYQVPVLLQIGKGEGAVRRRFDEFAASGRLEFHFDFAASLAEHLEKRSEGRGCGIVSALQNGDFVLPASTDATPRLFGVDSVVVVETGGPAYFQSTVDLSRGINLSVVRHITLAVDNGPPRRIDCAGAEPARTRLEEIVAAINRAMGAPVAVAGKMNEGPLVLLSQQPPGYGGRIELFRWCSRGLPESWQGTGGKAVRVLQRSEEGVENMLLLLADSEVFDQGFLLGETLVTLKCHGEGGGDGSAADARLSQRFSVGIGCSYRFTLPYHIALAAASPKLSGCQPAVPKPSRWEVEWFDRTGSRLRLDGAEFKEPGIARSEGGYTTGFGRTAPAPAAPLDVHLDAPEGAIEAELRILHPSSAQRVLLLGPVTFLPAAQAAANGEFSAWTSEEMADGAMRFLPADWHVESGWVEPVGQVAFGVKLVGSEEAPEEGVLSQTINIKSGADYLLKVKACGRPAEGVGDEERDASLRPRLELRWLLDGLPGETIHLFLDDRGFPTRSWSGQAPATAQQAELRLVQPLTGANLIVEEVRLEQVDTIEVPLTFLGESLGELKVSNLRVAYDLPLPAASVAANKRRVSVVRSFQMQLAQPGLAAQPAAIIAGVGRRYSAILQALPQPVRTVGELAALAVERAIPGIPRERLMEMRTAAEIALDLAAACGNFAPLAKETVAVLLTSSGAELARRSRRSVADLRRLQKQIRGLALLLNNKALYGLTLGDLTGSSGAAQ